MAKLLSIAALAAAVALQASAHGEEQHAGSDSGAAHHEEGQEGDGMVDSANTFIRIRYYTSPSCSGSFVRDEFKEAAQCAPNSIFTAGNTYYCNSETGSSGFQVTCGGDLTCKANCRTVSFGSSTCLFISNLNQYARITCDRRTPGTTTTTLVGPGFGGGGDQAEP